MKLSLRKGQLIKWSGDRTFGFIQPADISQSKFFLHVWQIKYALFIGNRLLGLQILSIGCTLKFGV